MLRHLALSGLGLLHLRIGELDEALSALDRALVVFPDDAYTLYLRGRVLRELGELDEAVLSLEQALRVRDDLLEALAEMAETQMALADERPAQEAEHLFRAIRYADRLVELDGEQPLLAYVELQGVVHFRASDLRGARQAFARAEGLAKTDEQRLFSQVGLALVDYAQGRTDSARRAFDDLVTVRPVGDPYRDYARSTNELIDDHAEKELIVDRFEREGPELGSIWESESDRALRPRLRDGRLAFAAVSTTSPRSGRGDRARCRPGGDWSPCRWICRRRCLPLARRASAASACGPRVAPVARRSSRSSTGCAAGDRTW